MTDDKTKNPAQQPAKQPETRQPDRNPAPRTPSEDVDTE